MLSEGLYQSCRMDNENLLFEVECRGPHFITSNKQYTTVVVIQALSVLLKSNPNGIYITNYVMAWEIFKAISKL